MQMGDEVVVFTGGEQFTATYVGTIPSGVTFVQRPGRGPGVEQLPRDAVMITKTTYEVTRALGANS